MIRYDEVRTDKVYQIGPSFYHGRNFPPIGKSEVHEDVKVVRLAGFDARVPVLWPSRRLQQGVLHAVERDLGVEKIPTRDNNSCRFAEVAGYLGEFGGVTEIASTFPREKNGFHVQLGTFSGLPKRSVFRRVNERQVDRVVATVAIDQRV